jgi:hypothetical protein
VGLFFCLRSTDQAPMGQRRRRSALEAALRRSRPFEAALRRSSSPSKPSFEAASPRSSSPSKPSFEAASPRSSSPRGSRLSQELSLEAAPPKAVLPGSSLCRSSCHDVARAAGARLATLQSDVSRGRELGQAHAVWLRRAPAPQPYLRAALPSPHASARRCPGHPSGPGTMTTDQPRERRLEPRGAAGHATVPSFSSKRVTWLITAVSPTWRESWRARRNSPSASSRWPRAE